MSPRPTSPPATPAARGGGRPPPRGRPRDADKRVAVIEAAKQLFAVHGLLGTSMDAIAKTAGVSKVTLYSHFTDKDALFREAVSHACQVHTPPERFDPEQKGDLRQRLTLIADGFFQLITSPEPVSLYRLMAANPRRHRKLSGLYWQAGPEATMERFTQLLAAANASGELKVDDLRAAAGHFFCLIKGEYHHQMIVGVIDKVTPAQRRDHVEAAVAMFMRAYKA